MDFAPPLLILVIAAAGFVFCTQCNLVKYDVLRESGHRLYLGAIVLGFIFYSSSFFLYQIQKWLFIDVLGWPPLTVLPSPSIVQGWVAVCAALMAIGITVLVNRSEKIKEWSLDRAWKRSDVDALCRESILGTKPVTITLDTGKAYIGLVYDTLEPGKEAYLTILPLYSGYRDKETHELRWLRRYQSVMGLLSESTAHENDVGLKLKTDEEAIDLRDYRIVIPRERILLIHISAQLLYDAIDEPMKSF